MTPLGFMIFAIVKTFTRSIGDIVRHGVELVVFIKLLILKFSDRRIAVSLCCRATRQPSAQGEHPYMLLFRCSCCLHWAG